MANAFTIPFNYHISGSDDGNTGSSYTCPSGKRARVTATLYVEAYGQHANSQGVISSNSNSTSLSFWIDDGDIVSASATAANTNSTATGPVALTGTSTATLQYNNGAGATTMAEIKATGVAVNHTASASVLDVDGTADVYFYVEEYDNIT